MNVFKLLFISLLAIFLFACSQETGNTEEVESEDQAKESESEVKEEETNEQRTESEPVGGGELRVGVASQPPSIDPHLSTTLSTKYVARQIFESLITIDSKYGPVPELAESIEESDDGKTYTFPLRQGVKFHNGKEMTADDVVVSMNRWKELAAGVPSLIKEGTFEAIDDYTVTFEVEQPSALTLPVLAKTTQAAAIMPKEVIESAAVEGVGEYIGTGPFKFVEWKQDQYIHLAKYEDYQVIESPSDGLGGKKEALVDDLYFDIVPDASTQVSGLQTGQYDLILDVPNNYYEHVLNHPDIEVDVSSYGKLALLFDKNEGWFTDDKMRQAVNTALDLDSVLLAAFINEDLYHVGASHVIEEQEFWYTEAGSDFYNQHDTEKAKQLLEESGYNGEPITLLSTRDYEHIYNASVVVKEQLDAIGMNIELEIFDYATVIDRRSDPKNWEIFITGFAEGGNPIDQYYFDQGYFDGPNDEKTVELIQAIERSTSHDEAKTKWEELQAYLWETVPIIKLGDFMKVSAFGNSVGGFQYFEGPVLWNVTNTK